MPRVSRTRTIAAPVDRVWELVSDPYHLPRWWPRCVRVEDVRKAPEGKRTRWTAVLETEGGKPVRADFRCLSSADRRRYIWEQELEGTPFERILRSAVVEIDLVDDGPRTKVKLVADQRLRGFSRLGSPMMRAGTGRTLSAALAGLDEALVA